MILYLLNIEWNLIVYVRMFGYVFVEFRGMEYIKYRLCCVMFTSISNVSRQTLFEQRKVGIERFYDCQIRLKYLTMA